MPQKNILGLDLGTNSIGWAIISETIDNNKTIEGAGTRIIPMDAGMQSDFAKGASVSQTAERTKYRGMRRILERRLLRRERLHRILSLMGFLPKHYDDNLTRYGKFKNDIECKLAWTTDDSGRPIFLFQNAFNEMLHLFKEKEPQFENKKIPYDWTLYYLRTKALTEAISPEEFAWILLSFNQKRGYYQIRGEEENEHKDKIEKYLSLKIIDVVETGEKGKHGTWYNIHLENGMIYPRTFKERPDLIGKTKDFIVTTSLNKDGSIKIDKNGKEKRSLRIPNENDWTLLKLKTQDHINNSRLTVGQYIFNELLKNPKQKIKGKLIQTIDRHYYKDELYKIVETQKKFISQLNDKNLYQECIKELYPQNDAYRNSISTYDFAYLFINDILFYQRPLKSKKSLIDNCPFESREYKDGNGDVVIKPIKCISKYHPLYQEFRLWQFIGNLKLYKIFKDEYGRQHDTEITSELLPDNDAYTKLFDYLYDKENISQKKLFDEYFKITKKKNEYKSFRWNYVEDKEYPCNIFRGTVLKKLNKANINTTFFNNEAEEQLWHILYSISDKTELKKALKKYAALYLLNNDFVEIFSKYPPFESKYGAMSAKALKKMLPLMRRGRHWKFENIDKNTQIRINKIITGETDDTINNRVREKASSLNSINDFQGLPTWLSSYIIYNRHSEVKETNKWSSPSDIDEYLNHFKQHSLKNPVVEQVITETLRVVRDLWEKYKHIDEIHLELGRELKNDAETRKQISIKNAENEKTNLRIKNLLTEFANPEYGIENVRPFSLSQQASLRIYENIAINSVKDIGEDIKDIINTLSQTNKKKLPSSSDIKKYKLWLEQHYRSPYTGQTISISRLFTSDYEIEHIIPQSRYFDDSLSNKVICESEVNKLKGNMLAYEFISKHQGEKVSLSGGRTCEILKLDSYCQHIEDAYKYNRQKKKKLLLEDIPTEFIERQLNDSRYISKFIKSLLSNIVREEGEQEDMSKNMIVCTGAITDRLKQDWGVNNIWNHIVLPRFLRMNEITGRTDFITTNQSGHAIPNMPLELQKGFNKKRIDHRHHAMDALVIACTTRDHVNLLNNEAALPGNNINRHQLSHKLRNYEKTIITKNGEPKEIMVAKEFKMPWTSFPSDIENALRQIIVSFKKNTRVINNTTNRYTKFIDGKKKTIKQLVGDNLAIRKSMHKETIFGEIDLIRKKTVSLKELIENQQYTKDIVNRDLKKKLIELLSFGHTQKTIEKYFKENKDIWNDVNLKKIEVNYHTKGSSERYFATRKPIDTSFNKEKIENEIADSGIQKIMLAHLKKYNNDPATAFSPEGIEDMNQCILELNNGHFHQPIYKVRWYEKATKFAIGQKGNRTKKFVEASKGTNLFFAIYETTIIDKKSGEVVTTRDYRSIPLHEAISKLKANQPIDDKASFILSPNDLVYLPTAEERKTGKISFTNIDRNRIYKMVSCDKKQCFFIPEVVAKCIQEKIEYNSHNKIEKTSDNELIKDLCIPLTVNRIGDIINKNNA